MPDGRGLPRGIPSRARAIAGARAAASLLVAASLWIAVSAGSAATATTLDDARELIRASDFAGAEALCRQLVTDAEASFGEDSPEAAEALDLLVEALWRANKVKGDESRALANRAIAIRESAAPPDTAALAGSISNLGTLQQVAGDYTGARASYEHALALLEQHAPTGDRMARTLTSYGNLLYRMEDYGAARATLERAGAVYGGAHGGNHAALASVHQALGKTALAIEDFEEARRQQARALEIWIDTRGPMSLEAGKGENGLGQIARATGDYAGALAHFERALAIVEGVQGPEGSDLPIALTSVGQMHYTMGDYANARRYLERSLALQERLLGTDHPQVLPQVLGLATLESALGNYEVAAPMFARAASGFEKAFGAEHTWVATALSGQGQNASRAGEHTAARALLERALAIREKVLGPDRAEVATSLDGLASVLEANGDVTGATSACERALAIRERTMRAGHPELASSLRRVGRLAAASGQFVRAERLIRRAVSMEQNADGRPDPELAQSLEELASVLVATGRAAEAFDAALRAEEIAAEHLRATARSMQERDALRYDAVRASGLDVAFEILVAQPGEADRGRRAWDRAMRSRALVLDEMASRHGAVARSNDPEVAALARRLDLARHRLSNLTVREPGAVSADAHERLLSDAYREKDAAERALAERSVAFREGLVNAGRGLDEVAAALPDGGALVAYFRFVRGLAEVSGRGNLEAPAARNAAAGGDAYLAFVLRADAREPLVVPLGAAGSIDSAIVRWTGAVLAGARVPPGARAANEERSRVAGNAVRAMIWDPVATHVGAAERVFITPDAAINTVSFAALPASADAYLVELGPAIHYLSSERDLLDRGAAVRGSGLLALGGADYDARPGDEGLGPIPDAILTGVNAAAATGAPFRGKPPSCRGFSSLVFEPLPEADQELRAIARIWREASHVVGGSSTGDVVTLSRRAASEESFKRRAPGRQVLHLATHGFFLGKACAPVAELEPSRPLERPYQNPLLLAGLAMAGANQRHSVGVNQEDGILTAEEVAALDLSGVEWVVLSGCETGAGEIVAGEGVFGMRRAFQVAGAQTLVTSLWPVEDRAARAWMDALYEARFRRGLAAVDATREASLAALHELRASGRPTLPILWGGFVAAGDWR